MSTFTSAQGRSRWTRFFVGCIFNNIYSGNNYILFVKPVGFIFSFLLGKEAEHSGGVKCMVNLSWTKIKVIWEWARDQIWSPIRSPAFHLLSQEHEIKLINRHNMHISMCMVHIHLYIYNRNKDFTRVMVFNFLYPLHCFLFCFIHPYFSLLFWSRFIDSTDFTNH